MRSGVPACGLAPALTRKREDSSSRAQKLFRRLRGLAQRFAGPRLGRLHQYAPQPLRLPARYYRDQPPDAPPRISIVTPSFNQSEFLERTIRSVIDQCYPQLQYLIQDGGSQDGSVALLEKYAAHFDHCESAADAGQADAVNRGFARATGDILAWLNADDLLLPGTLAYVARCFHRYPDVDVVYGQRILIDENDREIGRWILPPHEDAAFLWRDFIPQETLFWRRRIWEKAGGCLDANLHFALDWDLLFRFHRAGAKFARLPRFLGAFRVHVRQKTSAQIEATGFREMAELLQKYHGRTMADAEIERRVRGYLFKHLLCHGLYRLGVLRY